MSAKTDELAQKIRDILLDVTGVSFEGVPVEQPFRACGLSAHQVVDTCAAIEEILGIFLDDDEIEHADSLQYLVNAVVRHSGVTKDDSRL